MRPDAFTSQERGVPEEKFSLEGFWAFHPTPLPRRFVLPQEVVTLLDEATGAVYRLGGVGRLIPNPHLSSGRTRGSRRHSTPGSQGPRPTSENAPSVRGRPEPAAGRGRRRTGGAELRARDGARHPVACAKASPCRSGCSARCTSSYSPAFGASTDSLESCARVRCGLAEARSMTRHLSRRRSTR